MSALNKDIYKSITNSLTIACGIMFNMLINDKKKTTT